MAAAIPVNIHVFRLAIIAPKTPLLDLAHIMMSSRF